MRLTKTEVSLIKKAFSEVFDDGEVYLFGSRTDDTKKGGDIDLYVELEGTLSTQERLNKKSAFVLKLEDYLGLQKIDVVICKDKTRSIEQEALTKGIRL